MITCQELTELITDYLEGRMAPEARLEFEKHVSLCRHCREYLDQMKTTTATLGQMPEEPVPEEILATMRDLFRDQNQ